MNNKLPKVKFSELAHFTPRQKEANALMNKFKFLLYGGAMGGGKSYWLRWALLNRLLKFAKKGIRHVRVALFCEDYPTLKDRHLSKIAFEFPEWLGTLNESAHEFVLRPEYGSGVICFRNLDDPSKYQSAEFAAIAVDELTKNDKNVFDFLRTRLRWPGVDNPKFLAATNPGDIGHVWVKKLFIDHDFDDNEVERSQFAFLQALADDNPHISKDYLNTLDSLPEELRKAFRRGDWNVFKGQFFSMWRETKDGAPYHVLDSYQPTKLDAIFGSMDWGFSPDSFAYHLHAVVKINRRDMNFQRIITFAELYGNCKYPDEWAKEIKALEQGLYVDCRYSDPSADNKYPINTKKNTSGGSVLEEFYNNGVAFIKGNNDKKNGYQAQRDWLREAPDGFPYWQVTKACYHLSRQMPAAIYDPNNSFHTKEGGEDHAREGVRYFIISRPDNFIEPEKTIVDKSSDWFDEMEKRQKAQRGVLVG